MDKIRILLLDDKPDFAWDLLSGRPVLPTALQRHFELIWLQNAVEGKWVLDAFDAIEARKPQGLTACKLPPEILIFDYALTHGGREARPLGDPTNPIPGIQAVIRRHGLSNAREAIEEIEPPPDTGVGQGNDRTGCYVGGELARAFSSHPCGAVPTTARVDTVGSDAAFYEWLNREYLLDMFRHKSRTAPKWLPLLSRGVNCFRERAIRLAGTGLARIDVEEIRRLSEDPNALRGKTVTLRSKFGTRRLPVDGVFLDSLNEDPVEPYELVARDWANRMLQALFRDYGQAEFRLAKE